MDISVKDLEEAISIRKQIDNLQRRLSSILRGTGAPAPSKRKGQLTPAGRRKLSQLMKAAASLEGDPDTPARR